MTVKNGEKNCVILSIEKPKANSFHSNLYSHSHTNIVRGQIENEYEAHSSSKHRVFVSIIRSKRHTWRAAFSNAPGDLPLNKSIFGRK